MKFKIFLLCLFSFFIFLGFYNISGKELTKNCVWTIVLGVGAIGIVLSTIEGFLKFLDKIERWLQNLGSSDENR